MSFSTQPTITIDCPTPGGLDKFNTRLDAGQLRAALEDLREGQDVEIFPLSLTVQRDGWIVFYHGMFRSTYVRYRTLDQLAADIERGHLAGGN